MTWLSDIRDRFQPLRGDDRDAQRAWVFDSEGTRWVVKAKVIPRQFLNQEGFLAPDELSGLTIAETPQIPKWAFAGQLSVDEKTDLGLDERPWFLTIRPYIPGEAIAARDIPDDWFSLGKTIALALRDLHDTGVTHGDLHPGNIIERSPGDVAFIDLPIIPRRPEDVGFVAGTAPFIAPEIWEGSVSSFSSDIYALGQLFCWLAVGGGLPVRYDALADWAEYHRESSSVIPESLSEPVRSQVERMLSKDPASRPALQDIIDTLDLEGEASRTQSPVSPFYAPIQREANRAVRSLQETELIYLACESENTRITERLKYQVKRRLELCGWRIVGLSERGSERNFAESLEAARMEGGWGIGASEWPGPESFFSQFKSRLTDAGQMPDATILLLDVTSLEAQDIQRLVEFAEKPGKLPVPVVVAGPPLDESKAELFYYYPNRSNWEQWRNNSIREDIRDITQGRWRELIEEYSDLPDTFLRLIEREIGVVNPSIEHGKSEAKAIAQSVADQIEVLSQSGDHQAVLQRCRELIDEVDTSIEAMREILPAWFEALLRSGGTDEDSQLLESSATDFLRSTFDRNIADDLLQLFQIRGANQSGIQLLDKLSEVHQLSGTPERRWLVSWIAQFELSAGQFEEALERCVTELEARTAESEGDDYVRLQMVRSAVEALRGDDGAVSELSRIATKLSQSDARPLLVARCHAYRAFSLNRMDRIHDALDAHLRALDIVDTNGLTAELPTDLLNVGTAFHRQGQLGLARQYYARGTRVATSLTRPSVRGLLMANRAHIDRFLGRIDESKAMVKKAEQLARDQGLPRVQVFCASIRGDIAFDGDNYEEALDLYLRPLERQDIETTPYETAELQVSIAETLMVLEQYEDAGARLEEARLLIEEHELGELRTDLDGVNARLRWSQKGQLASSVGIERFRRALVEAGDANNYLFVIEQARHLWRKLEQRGLPELQDEVIELLSEAKRAVTTGLSDELKNDFYAHFPQLDTNRPDAREPVVKQSKSGNGPADMQASREPAAREYHKMLSLNEIVFQSQQLEGLWPRALDIALSISGAQRAFVLLKTADEQEVEYDVAASRDLEGNSIPEPELEVGLTIAREAAQTGQTVVTVDATDDSRFDTALSVVDLELKSVVCVPLQNSEGLLGALYVDHQYESGLFGSERQRLLETYGHQLAVGVSAVRGRVELQQRQEQLKRMKDRLEDTLQEREGELEKSRQQAQHLSEKIDQQRAQSDLTDKFEEIAFASQTMESLLEKVSRIATSDVSVVIEGESGVGKELIAHALHDKSLRSSEPFVSVNCGAISENLFESELFGHKQGAFTGANKARTGLFEAASGGTIFLDEVAEIPLELQVKLLRVLQEGCIRPVGASSTVDVDVRVVAATNRSLEQQVQDGAFREDLYYRLATIVLDVPPLRERPEDIPLISCKILSDINSELRLAPDGAELLTKVSWPGNVRELENTLRAAAALTEGQVLGRKHLRPLLKSKRVITDDGERNEPETERALDAEEDEATDNIFKRQKSGPSPKASREEVIRALEETEGNRTKAADVLGVSRRTLYRYLDNYGLLD